MVWTTIPDGDIDPESPIDAPLMAALRDNPIAIAGGLAGAPKVQNAALAGLPWQAAQIGAGQVGTTQLANLAATAAKLAAAAVQRAKLQTTTVSLSGSIATSSRVNIALSPYAFFPMIYISDTAEVHMTGHQTAGSADQPRFSLHNRSVDNSYFYQVDYRYINI